LKIAHGTIVENMVINLSLRSLIAIGCEMEKLQGLKNLTTTTTTTTTLNNNIRSYG